MVYKIYILKLVLLILTELREHIRIWDKTRRTIKEVADPKWEGNHNTLRKLYSAVWRTKMAIYTWFLSTSPAEVLHIEAASRIEKEYAGTDKWDSYTNWKVIPNIQNPLLF